MATVELTRGQGWRPEIEGWSLDILPWYERQADRLVDGAVVVEVGSFRGRSILYLAEALWNRGKRTCTLYAVDTWQLQPGDRQAFDANRARVPGGERVFTREGASLEVAANFLQTESRQVDLVFIDAAHDHESVCRDIAAWRPLVREGGLLAGHDYWPWGEHEGVGRAVDEAVPGVTSSGSVWWTRVGETAALPEIAPVTVIIPCHAQAHFLPQAFRSVLDQTHLPEELVMVCGDADSADMAHFLARTLARTRQLCVQVLEGHVRGRGEAMNAAMASSKSAWIVRLDADDVLMPSALAKLCAATCPDDKYAITSCHLQEFGERQRLLNTGPYFAHKMLYNNYLLSCSLFTRQLWEDAGGFEEGLVDYEDWAFWLAALPLMPRVSKVNEVLFRYRIHGANAMIAAGAHDVFLRSMICLRLPSLYPEGADKEARLVLAVTPTKLAARVCERARAFPENAFAQELAALMTHAGAQRTGDLPR